jgi:hypothetical protein
MNTRLQYKLDLIRCQKKIETIRGIGTNYQVLEKDKIENLQIFTKCITEISTYKAIYEGTNLLFKSNCDNQKNVFFESLQYLINIKNDLMIFLSDNFILRFSINDLDQFIDSWKRLNQTFDMIIFNEIAVLVIHELEDYSLSIHFNYIINNTQN